MIKRVPGFMRPGEEVQDDDEPTTTEVAVDPSTVRPMEAVRVNQCTAHRKNGDRCRKASIKGATVCRSHGGAAPQVQRAARTRLLMASDDLMKALLKIALSGEEEGTRLRAVLGALDRAGFSTKTELAVTHEVPMWEQVMQGLVFSDFDRGGINDDPTDDSMEKYNRSEAGAGDVIDAEVIEDEPDRAPADAPPSEGMEMMSWEDAYGEPVDEQRRMAEARAAGREGRAMRRVTRRRASDKPTEFDPVDRAGTRVRNSTVRRG